MAKLHLFEPQSEAWLAARQQNVTGTELACLFHAGFNAPMTMMLNKITPPEAIDNVYMRIGRILEPAVLECFKERLGIEAKPYHQGKVAMLVHDDCRLSASLDGVTPEGRVVECKTFGSENLDKAKEKYKMWQEAVPRNYLIQVHAQMLLTDTDVAYIGGMSYFFPLPFVAYEVHRDPEIDALIIRCVNHFWHCFDNDLEYKLSTKGRAQMRELLNKSTFKIFEDLI